MKIGMSAMWLHSGSDARNSGLSRYARCLIGAMLELPNCPPLDVFAPASFVPPESWSASGKCSFHPVRCRSLLHRVFWELVTAGWAARHSGVDLWFSLAQVVPLQCTAKRAVMVHDLIPLLFPQFHPKRTVLFYRFALRYAVRHSDLILANSEATRGDLVRVLGAPRGKIVVTPLGPGNLAPTRSRESVGREELENLGVPFERYLLTLGNLDPRKNLGGLLEAFAMIAGDPECTGLGLVVAGARRSNFDDAVVRRVRELGIEGRVAFIGYVADERLPALFARAELFVFPSLYEGFGLPVLEAMLYGAPVVCSAVSSLPEVGGDAVLYFDPTRPEHIASAIMRGLTRLRERDIWVAQAHEVAKAFTWRRTAERTLAAFDECLGHARGRREEPQ